MFSSSFPGVKQTVIEARAFFVTSGCSFDEYVVLYSVIPYKMFIVLKCGFPCSSEILRLYC